MSDPADTKPHYDKEDQYWKIQNGLLPGETVFAVFDAIGAGTGFIGLTDRRVIIQDNSFVGGKQALTSIPFRTVQTVSFVSDKSMFGKFMSTSSIAITAGGSTHRVDFRGDDKAKYVHDFVLTRIL